MASITQWNTQLLATDLSTRVLNHAIEGKYLAEQIAPLPDKWKRAHFTRISNEEYEVKKELKKDVVFRQFNLMDDIKFKGLFHIVFLRNVMIYFTEEAKDEIYKKFNDSLKKDGILFVGSTEQIISPGESGFSTYKSFSIRRCSNLTEIIFGQV